MPSTYDETGKLQEIIVVTGGYVYVHSAGKLTVEMATNLSVVVTLGNNLNLGISDGGSV